MSSMQYAFDDKGLVPAILQDRLTGRILMVAWMNQEAIDKTRSTGEAHFYSRSRKELWRKGSTSGNSMKVLQVLVDCDADTVLVLVDPTGPACHTGARSCFFRDEEGQPSAACTEIERLEEVILERQASSGEASYTKALFEAGHARIGEKVLEEAAELALAIASESDEQVTREAADLVYHALVAIGSRGVAWQDVLAELRRRSGVSGIAEKAGRGAG